MRTIHRGVYVVGPKLMTHAREMAAVLAGGPGAVISHHTAGKLWELLPWVPTPSTHHVSVPGRNPGHRAGLTIHRVTAFLPDETTTKHGIPVTSPARTLLDLSVELDHGDLEQAIGEAFARGRASRTAILAVLDRRRGHRGAARLRDRLSSAPARTRSRTERRLLALLRAEGVPEPEVNRKVGGWEVDMLWRDRRLVVEIDGYDSHTSPRAFERDYRKTAQLETLGLRVIRVSADQVWDEPETTVTRIATA
jgi:very-short-patch-repair endonuclease